MIISTEKTSPEYLTLNSCGIQSLGNHDYMMNRPKGRVDYHILYIYSGRCFINENETITEVPAGNLILYEPQEPQNYSFKGADNAISMYIHFTGVGCKELLQKLNLSGSRIYHIGVSHTIKQLFQKMEYEYLLKKAFHSELCTGILTELLSTFGRKLSKGDNFDSNIDNRIADICKLMIADFSSWHNIDYYANKCNLSVSRFSHIFKKCVNVPPLEYLMSLRINRAMDLLSETDLPIYEISEILGFKSHNYFIRTFKKRTGQSPLKFKKNR